MKRNRVLRGVGIAIMATAALSIFVFLLMELWNWLMPQIFGWRSITYWQALGLLILSKILFGGFRGGHGHGHGGHWRRMREQMTPEQREKFRKGLLCGCIPSASTEVEGGTQQAGRS